MTGDGLAVGATAPEFTAPLVRPFSDRNLAVAEAFDVVYRALKLSKRSKRSCFLVDADGVVRYRWVGDHWLDPTRDTPPVGEIHEAVVAERDIGDPDTFGF